MLLFSLRCFFFSSFFRISCLWFFLLQTANRKRRKYIDYGKEIPFQRNAPAGFYDVSDENQAAKRARQDPSFSTK